ncbi:MAG: NAD/NADP octopine/nopaline dehydrogenase family protein [Clostridium sp.]|nr:NAD/NADP octopine/nopaline dehydrogenase family protein [Clostridium sp.]
MKICVVGAGNIGLALTSVLSLQNKHEVVLYTKKSFDPAQLVFKDIEASTEYENLNFVTETSLETALKDADYIFCTYPAFLRKNFIDKAAAYIPAGSKIGFVPGYGGAEYMCNSLVDKGVTIFGLQRVPFVARQENQKIATILSRKEQLFAAAIPKNQTAIVCRDLEKLIGIPTVALKEYMAVTLTPSNPLLHLTGLYNVFKDYKDGDYYDRQLMFYAEWNDETSELLLEYDKELQEICSRLTPLNLEEVVSLKDYYESPDAQAMTKKLKSIKAFEVVQVPLYKEDDKYYPDFNSRMFIEDFPYGIAIIKYFAILTNVETPAIDTILDFYKDKTNICYFNKDNTPGKDFEKSGIPSNFGLTTLEEIIKFYVQ